MLKALKRGTRAAKYGRCACEDILELSGARGERLFGQFVFLSPSATKILSAAFGGFHGKTDFSAETEICWAACVKLKKPSCSFGLKGEVPEALVPLCRMLENAEFARTEEGENRVFCFSCVVPETCEQGEYAGALVLQTESAAYELKVRLRVFPFAFPEKNRSKTAFAVWYENERAIRGDLSLYPRGEEYEEYVKYYELLKRYGIAATELPVRSAKDGKYCAACAANTRPFEPRRGIMPEDTANFVAAAKIAAADGAVASYSIPYDVVVENGAPRVDTQKLKAVLTAMAEASERDLDLFAKGYFYVTFIDEPAEAMFPMVRRVTADVRETAAAVARECDFTGKENVKRSLLSLENVVPSWPEEKLYGGVDTWCPTFSGWHAPEFRRGMARMFDLGSRNWWYGCISPWYPFPSYHLDEPPAGARAEGMLRYFHRVGGNLYWAVNFDRHNDDENHRVIADDVFAGESTWTEANGEGLLVFSGEKFGENAPLPSLRLAAVCEGNHDYEYCLLFEEKLEGLGRTFGAEVDARASLRPIREKTFFGTAVTDADKLPALRREIADGIAAADMGALLLIGEEEEGGVYFDLYAENGLAVSCERTPVAVERNSLCMHYRYFAAAADKDVYARWDLEKGGKTFVYRRLIAPPLTPLDTAGLQCAGAVEKTAFGEGFRYETSEFCNDACPSLVLKGRFDFSRIDSLLFFAESFSESDFTVSAVFEDGGGRKFNVGYGVMQKGKNRLRIHFNPAMQLNGWREVKHTTAFSHYSAELAKINRIDKKDIRKIYFEIQNEREFCSLSPRELRYARYRFSVGGIYFSEWTDHDPHGYDFLKEEKDDAANGRVRG